MIKDTIDIVYDVCATVSVIAVVVKLFHGWLRSDQIGKRFIVEMAEDHLPYIYREIRTLHPTAPDHPHIGFLNFKDK